MRIVICDDHQLLVAGMALALADLGHVVEAAVTTTAEAVHAVTLREPDALLVDLSFPEGSGLDVARHVARHHPRVKVVILTGADDPRSLSDALAIGVAGFIRKGQPMAAIADALERAAAGEFVADRELLMALREQQTSSKADRASLAPLDTLTEREHHVIRLMSRGLSTAEMATTLDVTASTVKTHVQSIFVKLQVHSRLQAVAVLHRAEHATHGGQRVAAAR